MSKPTSPKLGQNPLIYTRENLKGIDSTQLDRLLDHFESCNTWISHCQLLRDIKDRYVLSYLKAISADIDYIECMISPDQVISDIHDLDEMYKSTLHEVANQD